MRKYRRAQFRSVARMFEHGELPRATRLFLREPSHEGGSGMRAVALDIGEVRIGVAASDVSGTIASPVCVLPAAEVVANARSWRRVLEDHEPEVLVCGLPMTMAGEEGPQAQRVREVARRISDACGVPLEFTDERLSSAEAKRILHRQGLNERRMRGKVDMVAASLFLQTWLDAQRN